jgi:hypothetical protein
MLCSVDPPGDDPMDVMLARSTDGGATWSAPVRINDDAPTTNAWQWFGTMAVAPNGRIDVVWNDTRDDPSAATSVLYSASSFDGGATWSPGTARTPAFNSLIGWPNQNKIGDYYHLLADDVGADLAYAATFNGEQDVYFLRIGGYDCNRNGVADDADLAGQTSPDCNENAIPDECELAAGTATDANGNGRLDECDIAGDINGDGLVNVFDLLALLAAWGPCPPPPCPADVNADGDVGIADLLTLLANWT